MNIADLLIPSEEVPESLTTRHSTVCQRDTKISVSMAAPTQAGQRIIKQSARTKNFCLITQQDLMQVSIPDTNDLSQHNTYMALHCEDQKVLQRRCATVYERMRLRHAVPRGT